MLDSRLKGRGLEPHRRPCVVSLSKNIYPSLVLVQPRKTRPFITERLLMGHKESNQTNKQHEISNNLACSTSKGSDQSGHTHSLIIAFASCLNILTLRPLTKHYLVFLSLKGGCTGLSESTLVKMPHCWRSHVGTYFRLILKRPTQRRWRKI